ncbi:putative vacuolar amino acid transporter YPQ1 [Cucumis melo var. makuwa]|uniref:Vacuolar amino acid transporter YPQ1 n=1 Tax=Cucumis melo var. makuwa TaxID=1194695 RepID=A0A5A7TUR1_CUCMM|nr:putative vacuolar amino acid transporter YPQ1 [Cucumis melo var. makuwa]
MEGWYCVKEQKRCVGWVETYFKDCLCNLRDDMSFGFGLVSLLCWGLAEIPQIVTNFRTKSSHGVSLLFLLTWVAGDVFNLVGCLLEPATVSDLGPSDSLYTVNTIVLVLQSVYYDYVTKWCIDRKSKSDQTVEEEKTPLKGNKGVGYAGIPIPKASPKPTPRREFYYTSARSLAGSDTPPFRAFLRLPKSGPSALGNDSSSSDEESDTAAVFSHSAVTQPRPIPRSVGYGTFLAASANLPFQSKGFSDGFSGRKLLQEHSSHSGFGQLLGWLMAAIYMGGRLPQIWLNVGIQVSKLIVVLLLLYYSNLFILFGQIKRGSVEGLNPLMFVFALIANATYVASIVVRSTEWENIKANMPWLLDAVVCVLLDLFVSFSTSISTFSLMLIFSA